MNDSSDYPRPVEELLKEEFGTTMTNSETPPKKESKSREKKIYRSFVQLEDGKLAEQITSPELSFEVYDPITEVVEIRPSIQIENLQVYPLSGDLITKKVILLPERSEEYSDTETLRQECKAFIHKYLDIHPFYEELASYYILLTWLFDKNTTITYLGIFGDYGTGKTRAAQTIGALCYKAAFVSGALTCAPIYRLLEQSRGTLIINEFDFQHSDMGSELIKILNNGYEKGLSVLRVKGETGEVEAFDAFSPKIFTYRKKKNDQAFESRLITIPVEETIREDIPVMLPLSYEKEAMVLRNKLLKFRFRNFHKEIVVDHTIFIGIERRLRQTLFPLLTVVDDKNFLHTLTKFIQDLQEQNRVDRGMSWVAEHLVNLVELISVNTGDITVQDLAAKFNDGKQKENCITSRKAGSIIRNDFKLKTERLSSGEKKGQYGIKLDYEKIKTLCLKYGIDIPEGSSLHSPSSPQNQSKSEDSEGSEHTSATASTFPIISGAYTINNKEELSQTEKELRNNMQDLDRNTPDYANLYSTWLKIRNAGVGLKVFSTFVPGTNE